MNRDDWFRRLRQDDDLQALVDDIPYARHLGITVEAVDDTLQFVLAPHPHNIGNPLVPALHGGVVAAFLETAGTLALMREARSTRLPKIIDFSIDYLRSAAPVATRAECLLVREGRRLANVRALAWQDDPAKPVATARMHFLLSDPPPAG
ncbi:PaaI family thioesterase [Modicisalibacter coralii]|uniref:PaaI family thioesterase n=1 Tax=Modicisalibacter coralii TaxID=2304602 RepID=UPI00100AC4E1|nr:PaaI family thioesterase [Halomonas coralii]